MKNTRGEGNRPSFQWDGERRDFRPISRHKEGRGKKRKGHEERGRKNHTPD